MVEGELDTVLLLGVEGGEKFRRARWGALGNNEGLGVDGRVFVIINGNADGNVGARDQKVSNEALSA